MNPREPSRTRPRVRPSPRILALLLLPVLAPEQAGATPRPRPSVNMALRFIPEPPIAYLRNIDPVPLRFETEPLPPAPWPQSLEAPIARPEATFVPDRPIPAEESSVLSTTETGRSATTTAAGISSDGSMPSLATPGPESPAAAAPARTPSSILVDELRPTVRPEDFLPYFILPGSHAGETGTSVIVPVPPQPPAPPAQPASSARFIQTR